MTNATVNEWSPAPPALPEFATVHDQLRAEVPLADALRLPYLRDKHAATGRYAFAAPPVRISDGQVIYAPDKWRFTFAEGLRKALSGREFARQELDAIVVAAIPSEVIDQAYRAAADNEYRARCAEAQRVAYEWTGPDYDPARTNRDLARIVKAKAAELAPEVKTRVTVRHKLVGSEFVVWVDHGADFARFRRGDAPWWKHPIHDFRDLLDGAMTRYNRAAPKASHDEDFCGYVEQRAFEIDVRIRQEGQR